MSSGIRQRRSITSAEIPFAGEPLRRGQRHRHGGRERDHGDVAALAGDARLPERYDVVRRRGLALVASSPLCSKNTTGSSLRIADAIRPTTSAGVDGATIFSPGTVSAQFSTDCECCAPKPSPPPFAVRTTSGTVTWPPVM